MGFSQGGMMTFELANAYPERLGSVAILSVRIISESFSGMRPIDRHRLVYDALGEMMETDIHAVNVTALPTTSTTY